MRVNVDSEALSESRLEHFAELIGESKYAALGRLVCFWHDSQAAMVENATDQQMNIWLRDTREHKIRDALVLANYASLNKNGSFFIHGNRKHVQALKTFKKKGRSGGLARARKKASVGLPNSRQFNSSHINSIQEETKQVNEEKKEIAIASAEPPVAAPKQISEVFQIRDSFCSEYQKLYGAPYGWDHRRDGAQAKGLLAGGAKLAEVLGEVEAYFGWKEPRVIADGHSFSHGYTSFVSSRHRLRADLVAPERHKTAALLRHDRTEASRDAVTAKLLNRSNNG